MQRGNLSSLLLLLLLFYSCSTRLKEEKPSSLSLDDLKIKDELRDDESQFKNGVNQDFLKKSRFNRSRTL